MTRTDAILGPVRRCRVCREWWPDVTEFYEGGRYQTCRACRADRANDRPIPLTPVTHGSTTDLVAKRRRDLERKAALRRDPVLGDKLRARNAAAQRRYYERNRAAELERARVDYAARLNRPVRVGFGRPRIAA